MALTNAIGVVADDLTGACDTALQFFEAGASATVLLDSKGVDLLGSAQTVVINSHSRHLETYDAIAAVKKSVHALIEKHSIEHFYKKIDSTFRGNVAQECLALLDEIRGKACIVAPAFPSQDRITVGGYQLIGKTPLEQTDAARDPLSPVRQSYLPELLAKQSTSSIVHHIPLSTVVHGAGPIKRALLDCIQNHKKLIVVDACSDTDLEQLALAINTMPVGDSLLAAGSAGLAKSLSRRWLDIIGIEAPTNRHPKTLQIPQRPILVVMGSLNRVTRIQMQSLLEHAQDYRLKAPVKLVALTPSQILNQQPPLNLVATEVEQALTLGQTVLLTTALTETSVAQTLDAAQDLGLSPLELNERVNQAVSMVMEALPKTLQYHLVVGGGETAYFALKAKKSKILNIKAQMEAAIALSQDEQGQFVVTKSGGFGDRMVLLSVVKKLETWAE